MADELAHSIVLAAHELQKKEITIKKFAELRLYYNAMSSTININVVHSDGDSIHFERWDLVKALEHLSSRGFGIDLKEFNKLYRAWQPRSDKEISIFYSTY